MKPKIPPPPDGFTIDEAPATAISIPAPPSGFTIDKPITPVKATKNDMVGGYQKTDLARKIIPQFTKGLFDSDLPYAKDIVTNNPLLSPEGRNKAVEINQNMPEPQGVLPWLARKTGEIAPAVTMAIPFEGVAGAALPPLSTLGKSALGFGAYQGTKDVLQGKQDEAPLDALKTAATIWGGGKLIGLAGKGIAESGKLAGTGISKASMALKTMTGKLTESELGEFVQNAINKAIRPSARAVGKGSASAFERYHEKAGSVINDIIQNKDGLEFVKDTGEVIKGRLPESLDEMLQAVNQRMGDLFQQSDEIVKNAGGAGIRVDLHSVADDVMKEVDNPEIRAFFPEVVQSARTATDAMKAEGSLSPQAVQRAIAALNNAVKGYYRSPNPSAATQLTLQVGLVSKLRNALDKSLGELEGPEYSALKRQYGAYRGMLDDLLQRVVIDSRKNTKGFFDLTDVLIKGDIAHGILTMNPAEIVKGGVMQFTKDQIKRLNDPNNIVKTMFRVVEKTKSRLAPSIIDAESKVMPELGGGVKLLEGPAAKETLRLGENASLTGKGRKLLEASSKFGPGEEAGAFQRMTPEQARKRMKDFAFKWWNPTKKQFDIPEDIALNPKTQSILKKMGIDPITGKYKFKPLKTAFEKAWERAKKLGKDEKGFAWVGDKAESTPSWIDPHGKEISGGLKDTHNMIAEGKPISTASGWVSLRKSNGQYSFDIESNVSLGKQSVENYLSNKKLPDDTKVTIQYGKSFFDHVSFYLKDLKENNFNLMKTIQDIVKVKGRGNTL